MKHILGTKQGMTQVFDETGVVRAATVLAVEPLVVTQVKTKETDAYEALQVAYGEQKKQRVNKPRAGVFGELGSFKHLKELRGATGLERGALIDVSGFAVGDIVEVSAVSKGKGFQGVVKRHGFKGGPRTHGQKHSEREPGSIGGSGGRAGGRVAKGMRMAGRMGADMITVKNLRILQIDAETRTLVISGAIPGRKGTLVEVRAK